MLDHATAARLREMKLNTMAEKLLWQMEQPEIQSLSFEERLGMLVDAEWTAKHARRIQRYIRQGEFRVPAVAEDVEYVGKQGITREDFLRLCDGGYLRNKQNVILSGPPVWGRHISPARWETAHAANAFRQDICGFRTCFSCSPRLKWTAVT